MRFYYKLSWFLSKFQLSTIFLEKYYFFWYRFFNYKRLINSSLIDFNKPHWRIFTNHWLAFIFIILVGLFNSFAYSIGPLIIAQSVAERSLNLVILLIILYIGTSLLGFVAQYIKEAVLNNIDSSIQISASRFFLTLDPLHYTTKSTGEILNKITRSTNSAKNILNTSTWTFFAFGGFGTLIGSAAYTDYRLFWVTVFGFSACGLFYALARFPFYPTFLKKNIDKEDNFFAVLNETITQLGFIRSIFATPEQYKRIRFLTTQKAITASTEVAYTSFAGTLSSLILEITKIPIAIILFERVQAGTLSGEVALGFFTIYWNNTWTTGVLAHNVQMILADWDKMADLWRYIQSFPKSEIKVLEEQLRN